MTLESTFDKARELGMELHLTDFERVPKVLRLNISGQPLEWISWQEAVCLYARNLVGWTVGDPFVSIRGGYSKNGNIRSSIDIHSIMACFGKVVERGLDQPPLSNKALFKRDKNICLYCSKEFRDFELTRDHVVPISRGGKDLWENVVSACKRCNQYKGNRLVHECGIQLVALPYVPNFAEYLAITNSGRILGDQMEFLSKGFSKKSRIRG